MKKLISLAILAISVLTIALAMLRKANAQSTTELWQVEVDIYSGLPNPVFTLTAEEMAQARQRLAKAIPLGPADAQTATVRPSMLGYRGIIVRSLGTAKAQASDTAATSNVPVLEMFSAKILQRVPNNSVLLDDTPSGLERYLVTLAEQKAVLADSLAQAVVKSIP